MMRRTRTFAGFLALAAMTASFSEAALASVCASPVAMSSMSDMAMDSAESDGEASEHGPGCDWMNHTEESRGGGEHCPLTPTASQGCTVAASAPAPEVSVVSAAVLASRDITLAAVEPELLLARALYHPPRA